MYDGYCFSPNTETVYNPVSIGQFFFSGGTKFKNYWIKTGGSKLLYDIASKIKFNLVSDLNESISLDSIENYDIIQLATGRLTKVKYQSLLYQSGYLTIKRISNDREDYFYLDFPNKEVSESFSKILLPLYVGEDSADIYTNKDVLYFLEQGKLDDFMSTIKTTFASVPNLLIGDYEYSFQTGFYCMLKIIGANINSEVNTNKGRIDAVLETQEHIYIFEFKIDKSADEAILQIESKGYAEKYHGSNKRIHLVGVAFSSNDRNISSYSEKIL